VLKLSLSARGPRFLLRDDQGRIYGLWSAYGSMYYAALLAPARNEKSPLDGLDFLEGDGEIPYRQVAAASMDTVPV
jgi:hypothetical protein